MEAEPAWILEHYGVGSPDPKLDSMARRCLVARRLVTQGAKWVQVTLSGWDAHEDLERRYRRLIRAMDRPVAALLEDMGASGLLDEVLVVWMGEFGRSAESLVPDQANPWGREHNGRAMAIWVAGPGVAGGTVVGATDEIGEGPAVGGISLASIREMMLSPAAGSGDRQLA